jgi:asparagine synthase
LFLSVVLMQGLAQRRREALRWVLGRSRPFLDAMASSRRLVARHRRNTLLIEKWADDGDSHHIRRRSAEAWYIQTRLESYAHQGARHAIVYAYPLLDLDLVDFSMQVPGIFLRSAGQRRLLFRQALVGILPDAVRLDPVKQQPFPGEGLRNAAAREHLLAILRHWGNNARIRDFLDLDFMTEMTRLACDPVAADPEDAGDLAAIDLTPAFQIGSLLAALDDLPMIEAPVDEAHMEEAGG